MVSMHHTKEIAVLGAGAWGTALAILLAKNGQSVRLWDKNEEHMTVMQQQRMHPWSLPGIPFPDSLHVVSMLSDAVKDLTDICLVVPSYAFRVVLTELKPLVSDQVRFVWGTKGLNPENSGFLHEIITELYSVDTPMAVLSGPSFAKEVAQGAPTAVSLAGNNRQFLQNLAARFHNGCFRVYLNHDLIGVQLCGVVKNVMAIAVGIADGMGYGANTRCALITRGLAEMSQLCVALGGLPKTMTSLAGVGDLVLTCTDNQSRNRRLGLAIGQGVDISSALKTVGESVEGYYNAKQLHQLAHQHQVSMPIVSQVYSILFEQRKPETVLSELLAREAGVE